MASTILFIDHTAELGGGELALLEIIRGLDRLRFHPVVVLGAEGPLAERLREHCETLILPLPAAVSKVRISHLRRISRDNLRAVAASVRYINRLRRTIQRIHPGLVYTNSLKADLLGGIAGRLCRRPVLWHVRDRVAEDYLPTPVVRLFRLLCRWIPTSVIGCSQSVLNCLRLPKNKSQQVVYSGVRLSEFEKRDAQLELHAGEVKPTARIGLVGRLAPWKGQHVFLEAAARVHALHPQVRFVLYGSSLFGDDAYEHALRSQVQELHLEEVVEFKGFTQDVVGAMLQLDVVVHASTLPEPFGQVIVQGMAAQKPVIATEGGGADEIITDGLHGLLVPRGDAVAMSQAMCLLLESPEFAASLAAHARERVRNAFTIEHTVEAVTGVFEGIVRTRAKVLMYNATGRVSGAEISLLNIVRRWNRDLLDLAVVCPHGVLSDRLQGLAVPCLTIPELQARYTSNPIILCRYLRSILRSAAELRRILLRTKPNLIHANSLRAGIVSVLASMGIRIRIQWHIHDNLPPHLIAAAIRMLAVLSRNSRFLWVSSATRANFCGGWLGRFLVRRGQVLMNAIDSSADAVSLWPDRTVRQELGIQGDAFCIAHIGQISPRKDQAGAIKAFARMLNKVPEAVLLIVGSAVFEAGEAYQAQLHALVSELAINDRVHFLGQREDVARLLRETDLVVLNSWSDPCPLTLLEAMHAGRPILASHVDGIPELIEDGRCGWLCPPGDVPALSRAMVRIARMTPQERDAIGRTAQARVLTLHSMDRYMARFLNLSRQALA